MGKETAVYGPYLPRSDINTYIMNESYVYLWRDRVLNKYYLGYHSGSNPKYICSSEYMLKEYNVRPQDFKRRILKYGPWKEMALLEKRLLKSRYHHFGSRYYNLSLSWPIYKRTEETIRKLSIAMSIAKLNQSEETKRKISETLKGYKGRLHTEEGNRKRSETLKGIKKSEETKRKMRGKRGPNIRTLQPA